MKFGISAATARRLLLIVSLILALSLQASAQAGTASLPVIIQISPTSSVDLIALSLGASVVDSIPGANTYLLNVPTSVFNTLPPALTGYLGIQWMELNTGVSLPNYAVLGLVSIPGRVASNWYTKQPPWQLIEAPAVASYTSSM